jgi:hypothetical protein
LETLLDEGDQSLLPPTKVRDTAAKQSSAGAGACQFAHIKGLGQVPSLSVELPSCSALMRNPAAATAPGVESGVESGAESEALRVIYLPDERRYYYRNTTEGMWTCS